MMGPEFRRNLWLELTPRRIVFMVGFLALVFFAAAVSGPSYTPYSAAETIYYLIVVIWGARNAGLSIVGEIRDRTWDLQRLSSIGAGEMTWGKLLGSTIYNWLGGAICLAVMLVYGFAHGAPMSAILDLVYYVIVGLVAQASALLASLVAIRRRSAHSRLDVFLYQLVGIVAALGVFYLWQAADPESALLFGKKSTDIINWWDAIIGARPFLLISLAAFTAWILAGCYREMRRELKMRNGPLVWFGFLVFIGLYVAGFDAWLPHAEAMAQWNTVALRLALAATAYGVLTYVMVLLEPKDRVLYRWYGSQVATGAIGRALWSFQAWIMSYIATAIVALALIWWLSAQHAGAWYPALTVAGLGFLTRDVAIFVFFAATRRRGDFAAIVTLIGLYVLIPAILDGIGGKAALPFFYPTPSNPVWMGPAIVWGEAVIAVVVAVSRVVLSEKRAA
ncbi:MAG: hypothetical protein JSR55_07110 [Proteobacteria bacterium]|nr:hypothetical protein [Pseudomonadota bacterium]